MKLNYLFAVQVFLACKIKCSAAYSLYIVFGMASIAVRGRQYLVKIVCIDGIVKFSISFSISLPFELALI